MKGIENMCKKGILMIMLLTGMCMAACSNSGEMTEQPEAVEMVEQTIATEETMQSQVDEASDENIEVDHTENEENLYEQFLNGEGMLYFDEKESLNIDYIFDEFVHEEYRLDYSKGYTFDEMIALISGAIEANGAIGTCKYYMIDAGQDGNLEMCIELSDIDANDWENITLLVKDIDGKLRCRYCLVSRSRFGYDITYDGVISGGGSGGAGYYTYDECVIDAKGDCNFLYKIENLYPGYTSYVAEKFQNVSNQFLEMMDEGYTVETIVAGFEDKEPTEDFVIGVNIYDTNFDLIEEGDSIYDEIAQKFADEGITVLNAEEVTSTIDERCLSKGVTKEMRNSFDKRDYQILFTKQ